MIKFSPSFLSQYQFFGVDGAVSISISDYIIQHKYQENSLTTYLEQYTSSLKAIEINHINYNRYVILKFLWSRFISQKFIRIYECVNSSNIIGKMKLGETILNNNLAVFSSQIVLHYGFLNELKLK